MVNKSSRSPLWVGTVLLVAGVIYIAPYVQERLGIGLVETPTATSNDEDGAGAADTGAPSSGSDTPEAALGVLRETSGNVLVSTAGLRYTPGSSEGHRLDHVLRHDNDLPDRSGKHGVFDGDRDALLAVIDEAYLLVLENDPKADIRVDGNRTICDVNLGRRIGYVGGQGGARDGHPPVHTVRLVLEEDRLITAYPLEP